MLHLCGHLKTVLAIIWLTLDSVYAKTVTFKSNTVIEIIKTIILISCMHKYNTTYFAGTYFYPAVSQTTASQQ